MALSILRQLCLPFIITHILSTCGVQGPHSRDRFPDYPQSAADYARPWAGEPALCQLPSILGELGYMGSTRRSHHAPYRTPSHPPANPAHLSNALDPLTSQVCTLQSKQI